MTAPGLSERLRALAAKEPLGVDISDYSDEWCAGFLAGQVNGIDTTADALEAASEQRDTLERERAGYLRDFLTARERSEMAEEEAARLREALFNHGYGAGLCRCDWCAGLSRGQQQEQAT